MSTFIGRVLRAATLPTGRGSKYLCVHSGGPRASSSNATSHDAGTFTPPGVASRTRVKSSTDRFDRPAGEAMGKFPRPTHRDNRISSVLPRLSNTAPPNPSAKTPPIHGRRSRAQSGQHVRPCETVFPEYQFGGCISSFCEAPTLSILPFPPSPVKINYPKFTQDSYRVSWQQNLLQPVAPVWRRCGRNQACHAGCIPPKSYDIRGIHPAQENASDPRVERLSVRRRQPRFAWKSATDL